MKDFFRRSWHLIVFVVYLLFASGMLHWWLQDSFDDAARYYHFLLRAWMPYLLAVLLCFVGGAILSLPSLITALRAKQGRTLVVRQMVFGLVCLAVALSRLWVTMVMWIPIRAGAAFTTEYVVYPCALLAGVCLLRCVAPKPQPEASEISDQSGKA